MGNDKPNTIRLPDVFLRIGRDQFRDRAGDRIQKICGISKGDDELRKLRIIELKIDDMENRIKIIIIV